MVWNIWIIFHDIWDVILPIDELIFFKMIKTTIQELLGLFLGGSIPQFRVGEWWILVDVWLWILALIYIRIGWKSNHSEFPEKQKRTDDYSGFLGIFHVNHRCLLTLVLNLEGSSPKSDEYQQWNGTQVYNTIYICISIYTSRQWF